MLATLPVLCGGPSRAEICNRPFLQCSVSYTGAGSTYGLCGFTIFRREGFAKGYIARHRYVSVNQG